MRETLLPFCSRGPSGCWVSGDGNGGYCCCHDNRGVTGHFRCTCYNSRRWLWQTEVLSERSTTARARSLGDTRTACWHCYFLRDDLKRTTVRKRCEIEDNSNNNNKTGQWRLPPPPPPNPADIEVLLSAVTLSATTPFSLYVHGGVVSAT